MFSQACVKNSVHGGLCPSMHHRSHDRGIFVQKGSLSGGLCPGRGGLCPLRSLSTGVSVKRGVSVQWGLCLGGLYLEGLDPGGSLSREVSVRETPQTETPLTVTSGQYASY